MKIHRSIREIYEEQYPSYSLLKQKTDELIKHGKQERWHYESRIKTLESFALKIESGRFSNGRSLEDFFACTLVVENQARVTEARRLIEQSFAISAIRPPRPEITHKRPDSFPFDDLRLYVSWPVDERQRPLGVEGLGFEVQIKTFLQHAWSIATHDLVYKSDDSSWPKERIAYQVKAMLEHAEVSIASAETLSHSPLLDMEDERIRSLKETIAIIRGHWEPEKLPRDLVSLAKNVNSVLYLSQMSPLDLDAVLREEAEAGRGPRLANVSPFAAALHAIAMRRPEAFRRGVLKLQSKNSKQRIVVPREVNLPREIVDAAPRIFIEVGEAPP